MHGTTSKQTDAVLLAGIASGDNGAYEELYKRHRVRMHRFVLRIVRDEDTTEDIVAESMLDVWRGASTFGNRAQVTTWLLAIARNKALAFLRQQKQHEPIDMELERTLPSTQLSAEEELAAEQERTLIQKGVFALAPKHKEVLELQYLYELNIREIALIVGIPENTAKTRIFYARKSLQEILAKSGVTSLHT